MSSKQSTLPPSPPQQDGPYGQPQGKRSWPARHKVLTALLTAVVGIVIIIVAANAGGRNGTAKTPAAQQTSSAASSAPSSAAGIGTPVRDGKFEFVVTEVTHAKSVGGEFGSTAQGQYTILRVSVKNIGNQSQTLADSAQYVYDATGRKYSADSTADVYLNGNANVLFSEINPGNAVSGLIAFDMPTTTQAVKAELHDSLFSGGVTVNLK